ncbi:MAG TPA: acyl-CoA dehydrogenase family protein [Acidimicrobiales bacterium]|nr:acyl-CoA dehydrogenase family protein [Acidimicrobiales bacterium]
MRLQDTPDEAAFRSELRAWLSTAVTAFGPAPPADDWPARRAHEAEWQRRLFEAGYAGIAWPKEYGGRGASAPEELIFVEETVRAHAPHMVCGFVGTQHAGPTLIAEGTGAQKARHLPAVLRGEEIWCQGFSEPEAGSDLASLRTRAVRDGDHYVVTGQKVWTSHAQVADVCELLVRTDPDAPKHAGLTWLILDMNSAGIELRPLRTLTGQHEFNEMFLDGVRVPIDNRVGDENDGWRVAMVTFSFERGTAFASELLEARELVTDLVDVARRTGAWTDRSISTELAVVAAELDAQWAYIRQTVSASARGPVGTAPSVFKLAYGETRERLGRVSRRILGRAGLALGDPLDVAGADHVERTLMSLSLSIATGTSQIQRDIVGERMLGLPRDR